jgi:hypothetical protein
MLASIFNELGTRAAKHLLTPAERVSFGMMP